MILEGTQRVHIYPPYIALGREMGCMRELADALWEDTRCWRPDRVRTYTQTDRQKWKQYIRQFHSVHLADIKDTFKIPGCPHRMSESAWWLDINRAIYVTYVLTSASLPAAL